MGFENILGNKENKKLLTNILETENISHSYMFIGKHSIGKLLFAKEFAKGILCSSNPKPCNTCISCIKFDNNNHPDFFVVEPEEGSIKNEQIRELNKKILEKPIQALKKVYIINDAETMTTQAQNSLLKTLEEPPEHAVIILITSNEHKMLNTIKSRVVKIYFNELEQKDIELILKKEYGIENTNNDIIKYAGGSVEMALRLYNNNDLYIKINEIFSNLDKIDIIDLLNSKEEVFEKKEFIEDILDYINILFYNLSKKDIRYINCLREIINTKERLASNANYNMTMDNFLFTVWGEIND